MSVLTARSRRCVVIGLMLALGMSLSACGNATSWKEEVLLHDGQKIIVERHVDRGGRHEVGQQPPIKEQKLTFTLPATNERIAWRSEFSQDVGLAEFQPLLLDVFKGTAYVVAHPVGCLTYNKWGRPNPPYVMFRYQGKAWQRIAITELPAAIKTPNIIFGSPDNHVEKLRTSFVTAGMVQEINSSLRQPEYKSILRETINYDPECIPMSSNGKGRWRATAWFETKRDIDSCRSACLQDDYDEKHCPCNSIFQRK